MTRVRQAYRLLSKFGSKENPSPHYSLMPPPTSPLRSMDDVFVWKAFAKHTLMLERKARSFLAVTREVLAPSDTMTWADQTYNQGTLAQLYRDVCDVSHHLPVTADEWLAAQFFATTFDTAGYRAHLRALVETHSVAKSTGIPFELASGLMDDPTLKKALPYVLLRGTS